MSYVIHLWEHPSPTSWAEADALQTRLCGKPAPPNPKFAQLARGLLQAFPHRREGNTSSPWIEGAPDGQVTEAVWALGIDAGQLDRVVPQLAEQAIALGLTVYDGQAGEVFLPGRWRLTPEGCEPLTWAPAALAPSAAERDAPLALLEARLRSVLQSRLAPRGFQLQWRAAPPAQDALAFIRETSLGQQRIEITPTAWSAQHWDLWLSCQLAPRLPAELLKWCEPQDTIPLVFETLPGLADFYRQPETRGPFESSFRCLGIERLERFLGIYADWVEQELVPVLDATADLAGYLRMDGQPAGPGVVVQASVAGLALAHCAGDPALAERAARYGAQRVPDPRPDLFRRRFAALSGFPQFFGVYARNQ